MKQIHLRSLTKSDASQIANLANNKKIWDNLRDYIPYPYHENDAILFIESALKESPQQNFGIVTEQNELYGVIGLKLQNDIYKKTAEIGYWIGEPFWGRGIATKAIELITIYGFEKLQIERIQAGIFEYNPASMKALEKNGYKLDGILRNNVFKNGQLYNEHIYSKLKNG